MRIQIISDLHREFGHTDLELDKADVLVLAGDIDIGIKGVEWLKSLRLDIPILYVLGNHEYYKGSYPKTLSKIKEAAMGTRIIILENDSIDIAGVRFHGTTLWTDFSLFGSPNVYGSLCQYRMNDYKRIRKDPAYSRLRSIDTFNMHQTAKDWLEKSLEASELPNIVITHHAPSPMSLPEEYKADPISSAYASDMEAFIRKHRPSYWIHGHIHTPTRYQIGDTEIICNPHGYISDPYNGFAKELIITIG